MKFDLIYPCCGPNFITIWTLRGLPEGAKSKLTRQQKRADFVCLLSNDHSGSTERRTQIKLLSYHNESNWQTNCENWGCPHPRPTAPFLGLCLCTEACVILVFVSVNPRSSFQNINKPAIGKRVQYSFLSYRPCYLNLYFIDHLYADRAFLAKVHWTAFKMPFHHLASFGKHWF